MMVQSHDNNWFYIFLCGFLMRTKKFYYHVHIAHFITRDFAHHEHTQGSINSHIFYRITISKSLKPCPSSPLSYEHAPSGSPPSKAPSLP